MATKVGNTTADKQAFANLFSEDSNQFTKTFGGTSKGTATPFISGYFGVYFDDIPGTLANYIDGLSASDITRILSCTLMSITVPSVTVNKTTFNGIGGKKWSVVTNIDVGDSISCRFTEFSGLPIAKIFYTWARLARSPRYHASILNGEQYKKSAYSCSVFYWVTRPGMYVDSGNNTDIEVAYCFTGCFPSKAPTDAFGSDVSTNDKVEIDMDFNVDEMFCSLDPDCDWVIEKCQTMASKYLKWADLRNKIAKGAIGGPKTYNGG